uniref:Uncharacterized protein n=1 Tax=Anguilla anguilla TaxID=7936 RepID=A0A0E9UU90_ANGAN
METDNVNAFSVPSGFTNSAPHPL